MAEQPVRLLMIEDDDAFAAAVEGILARSAVPFEVERRGTLAAGMERMVDNCLDAVLLDLNLADSAGPDTVRSVRSRFPALPIIVLTGLDDPAAEAEAFRAGAQEYLPKDRITPIALCRLVLHAIERQRRADQDAFVESIARLDRKIAKFRALGAALQGGRP